MDEYISRRELLARYDAEHEGTPGRARELIKQAPAADVAPVVRCSQCVQHEDNGYHFCNKWEHFLPDDSEFFCAFGERKEANT